MPPGILRSLTSNGVEEIDTREFFANRKVVLFAVPGAFTPGCTRNHLPDYVQRADAIRAKGFDQIACIAVNDAWVMDAWGRAAGAEGKVKMLADGSAHYVQALGLESDLSQFGMGIRSQRFSMVVIDGVVESVHVDPRAIEFTSATYTCGL